MQWNRCDLGNGMTLIIPADELSSDVVVVEEQIEKRVSVACTDFGATVIAAGCSVNEYG